MFRIHSIALNTAIFLMQKFDLEIIIKSHFNINSIRNKFDALSFIVDSVIDILLISETKLDHSFPSAQLDERIIDYRLDKNSKGGGVLLCFCENIPPRILKGSSTCSIETIFVEINLRKR